MVNKRHRRSVIDGTESIVKELTDNLDAAYAEYFLNAINKLNEGQLSVENLFKNQTRVTI